MRMTENRTSCGHLTDLIGALNDSVPANVRYLPTDDIGLALGNIVVTHDLERAARRALGGCVYFKETTRKAKPLDVVEAARNEAIRNVNNLLVLVAAAEKNEHATVLAIP